MATIKEMFAPPAENTLLCIAFPEDEPECEIKPGLIHALPTFTGYRERTSTNSGLSTTDPNKFLKEFHITCSDMKPPGVDINHLKLKAFPFALSDAAKEQLFDLPAASIFTWEEMHRTFLEKYFPASLATNIRKDISGARQALDETLYEYWERFKKW